MPLAAMVCYCRSCNGKEAHDPETVLDHAARRDNEKFTYELLSAMLAEVQERGKKVSATTVLSGKCLRSEVLKRTRPYTDDPKKLYASFRGTMFHGRLELNAHPASIPEARFHKYLDGLGWFSGSPDLVDPKGGYLYDYKFTKQNPVFAYPWGDHKEQVQVNRWLVDTCDYVEYRGALLPTTDIGKAEVLRRVEEEEAVTPVLPIDHDVYRANKSMFQPHDWQGLIVVYMDDSGPKPIMCTKSIDVPKKSNPKETKKARVADIWTDDRVEELVVKGYALAREALDSDGDPLPAIPDDYQGWKHPLCNYCPVKDDCVEEYIEEQVQIRTKAS